MDLTVKMNCGDGSKQEQIYLLKSIVEAGVLNIRKDFAKQIMPELKRYDFSFESNIFDKIKEDKELYYAYQANIAMAFKDEYHRFKKKKGKSLNNADIHEIANNSAKYFLDLLLKATTETTHNSNSAKITS